MYVMTDCFAALVKHTSIRRWLSSVVEREMASKRRWTQWATLRINQKTAIFVQKIQLLPTDLKDCSKLTVSIRYTFRYSPATLNDIFIVGINLRNRSSCLFIKLRYFSCRSYRPTHSTTTVRCILVSLSYRLPSSATTLLHFRIASVVSEGGDKAHSIALVTGEG